MATTKKPLAKAAVNKKPSTPAVKAKPNVGKAPAAKGTVASAKADKSKKSATVKPAVAKKAAPAKKAVAAPVKATAKKAAVPAKKVAPAKSAVPSKKAAPAPKAAVKSVAAPAKKAAPAKVAPAKVAPAKPAAKPVVKKAVPVPEAVKPVKKVVAAKPEEIAPAAPKKETKAEQRAAQKRTASAVQRVQAKVAAAIPKPQPKPAPMPTAVMPGREEKKNTVIIAHRRLEPKPKETEDNSITMINYQPDFTRSILDKDEADTSPLYRYSDDELAEFKELITARLATARKELAYQQGLITHKDATGAEDTENRYMNMEDGSGAMEREQLSQLASRQIQFINHLEKAMVRIENKTYGICRVTGKLIDKARLRAVPHATLSIEAKNTMSK